MVNKEDFKRAWDYFWNGKGVIPLLLNVIVAFLVVKFLIYPGLGFIFNTDLPVVAVVSGSMSHNSLGFNDWWEQNSIWYDKREITKERFLSFPLTNGFNKGDIMVLYGTKIENIQVGDVIVYKSVSYAYPIIHRVVDIKSDFETKGDHNSVPDSNRVSDNQVIGKAILRIPYLGWVKVWFTNIFQAVI